MFALRRLFAYFICSLRVRETLRECVTGKRPGVVLQRKVHVQASGSGQILCAPISVSHNATCGDVVKQIETVVGACTCFVPNQMDPTSMGRHITARSPEQFTGNVVDVTASPPKIYVFSYFNEYRKFDAQTYKTIEEAMINIDNTGSYTDSTGSYIDMIEVGRIYKRYIWKRRNFYKRFQVYNGTKKTQDEIIQAVAVFLLATNIVDVDLLYDTTDA